MARWSLFPHFIVRATGFPWELVEKLRCTEAGSFAVERAHREAEIERFRKSAPRIHNPSRSVLASLRAGRPIADGQVDDPSLFTEWNRIASGLQQANDGFERVFPGELDRVHGALRGFADDARFLEAVASSSPPVFLDLQRGRWSARVERQVASYVQRLSAKNETMSFFGPINYGRLDPDSFDGVRLEWSGPLRLTGRRTHAASWLVLGVSQAIAFDPPVSQWLVPRPKGFADPPLPRARRRLGEILVERGVITQGQLARVLERQLDAKRPLGELLVDAQLCSQDEISEALKQQSGMRGDDPSRDPGELLSRLVHAANGAKTLGSIARELGVDLAQLVEVAKVACNKRILTHQLELPSAIHLPLVSLVERVSGIPGPAARGHLEGLREVLGLMARYSASDAPTKIALNERMRELVEQRWQVRSPHVAQPAKPEPDGKEPPPERRQTQAHFYVDRLPMREECGGDLRIEINGRRASELIERLQRPLDLLGLAAEQTRQRARQRVAKLLGQRRVPFWKVVAAFSDQPIPYDDFLSEWLTKEVKDASARVIDIHPDRLPVSSPTGQLPLVCSIDLLVCAKSVEAWSGGDYQVVMGDIHDTALVWGWALQFHEDGALVERQMVEHLGRVRRDLPIITALASRRTGLLPAELPGPVIELGGVSARPSSWHLPFDDLLVASDGSDSHLWSNSLGTEVCLYNGELESLVHTAFALPRVRPPRVDLGAHTPRIVVDGVILQREQWRLNEAQVEELVACKDDRARIRVATRLWVDLGLPPVVFAKLPDERKPVLVDPTSPFLLRAFLNLLEHRKGAVLSEMLPSPDQLWLRGELGRHTAELRCTFIRD